MLFYLSDDVWFFEDLNPNISSQDTTGFALFKKYLVFPRLAFALQFRKICKMPQALICWYHLLTITDILIYGKSSVII